MADDDYKSSALTIRISSDSEDSRLKLVFAAGEKDYPPIVHPSPKLTAKYLETELVRLREKLNTWSTQYDSYLVDKDKAKCDPERVKGVWKELATWGRGIYRDLFDIKAQNDAELLRWSADLKQLKGERIVIDSAIGDLPWGLLYDEEVPESFDGDYVTNLLPHFWMTSYYVETLPPYPRSRPLWKPSLKNKEDTRLTVTINKDISGGGAKQQTFFEGLAPRLKATGIKVPSTLVVNYEKTQVIDSITKRAEPQHLLYFYCHHKKGEGTWTNRGYRNFDNTKMIIRGEDPPLDSETISIKEMEDNESITSFAAPPIVFLNACESAQTDIGDSASFMLYFINVLKSYAFIGTEAQIPASFADTFGQRFVSEFLDGRRIGTILYYARLEFALNDCNPFGMYYSLYGDGNVRLSQPV